MKVELTQGQIDGLIGVERVVVKATVHGVGFNDVAFQPSIDGKAIWQYHLWQSMMRRCFSEKEKQRYEQDDTTYQDIRFSQRHRISLRCPEYQQTTYQWPQYPT